jgi:hypothetical protein
MRSSSVLRFWLSSSSRALPTPRTSWIAAHSSAEPLLCPKCQKEMRIVSLIDDKAVIERILRHLGLWQQDVRVASARAPPEIVDRVVEPCYDDPFPNYDTEPVMAYANG